MSPSSHQGRSCNALTPLGREFCPFREVGVVREAWHATVSVHPVPPPWPNEILRSADAPGFRLHPLKGNREGQWGVRVSGNWRVAFHFGNRAKPWTWTRLTTIGDKEADCGRHRQQVRRSNAESSYLGEPVRESMDEVGRNVTETAAHSGCERGTLSRLLNGKTGVSANMALALEAIDRGTTDHWMCMQASNELAQTRRARGRQGDIKAHETIA